MFTGNVLPVIAPSVTCGAALPSPPERDVDAFSSAADVPADLPVLLLVEDDSDLSVFIKSLLSGLYRVEVAADGEEGWMKAQALLPDVVVSDVVMPRMNGIQLLQRLKADMTTSHIPVILLTERSAVENQIEGLDYGADFYITKPFRQDYLTAAIRNLVTRRKKLFSALVEVGKVAVPAPGASLITSQDDRFLRKMVTVVEEKMADVHFNVDAVALAMNMSRTTFYRKFKSLTNLAPVEFVRDMRLKRARQYLDAGVGNISEVAYLVGFNTPKYFTACFKARFNVTPTDYLEQQRGR